MLTILPIVILFAAMLAARYIWMSYLAQSWMTVCILYVAERGKGTELTPEQKLLQILDYSAVWPMSQMIKHFWIWDFRRFIVHQEILPKILDFAAKHSQSRQ